MSVDEYAQARPSAALLPYVGFYSGYRQRGLAPATHRGLPSPYLTVVFTMDDPLDVAAHPDPRQTPGRYAALIGGLHLRPALLTHPGRQSGVQVALRPLGCRALFGLPAAELGGIDVDAAAVLGAPIVAEIRDRLCSASSWPARFAAIDDVLGRRLFPVAVAPEIRHACYRLLGGGAARSVADVAGEVGWSPRYLTDRFRAEIGLRPKEAARIARFDRARRSLSPSTRLADVAAAHGYADQSHLVRDFRAFAGCTPTRWVADEFGFVQATARLMTEDREHERLTTTPGLADAAGR
ncbi:helix-turn-helix domain-containing protein [Paractinoplanes toevensis]|uniref:AraC family transcriptional regulator n=1 Tax=Paractinoplanes toevensis TaxID=571911 RepID=A0A919T719_9ACTN|nr:helix-turn-helix domain-containing protein [Actinoplanes toevensis]GIM90210.1 AraC family transcriptional regulator [Actinoplanes toevensis]